MINSAKLFFGSEKKLSRAIFLVILLVIFTTVFGGTIYAEFIRTGAGSTTFSYGYDGSGYGNGYGYGAGGDATYGSGSDGKATSVSASATQTTVTVNYTTSYKAKNQVNYGSTVSLGSNTTQTAFETGSNSATISGLTCNTTYYYQVASTDIGGVTWYDNNVSPYNSVTTSACSTSSGGSSSGGGGYNPWWAVATSTPNIPGCPVGYICKLIIPPRIPGCPEGYTCTITPSNGGGQQFIGTSFLRRLIKGITGDDVRHLQIILNSDPDTWVANLGDGSPGHETNFFGGLTLKAVQKFQVKHGIANPGEDGYGQVGPKTRAKLNELQS